MAVRSITRRSLIGLTAIVQLLFFPVVTFAESPSASTPATTQQTTGPTAPTGADAKTYTFNKETGLWENEYYTWNPANNQTSPKEKPAYSYNPESGMWDTTEWKYDAPTGKYVPQPVSIPDQPANSPSKPDSKETTENNNSVAPSTATSTNDKGTFNQFYNGAISNALTSAAVSGNSTVTNNTTGGSAQSGNALAIANVMNLLQSSWGMNASEIATFMATINGDVVGDLLLDPTAMLNDSLAVGYADTADIDVTVANSGSIHNDIHVAANSGNASVSANTNAGDATTGSATAIANVINLINSTISAGQSFVGNININGNLDGDILLPEAVKNKLKEGSLPTTALSTDKIEGGEKLSSLTTTATTTNELQLDAQSGDATVSNNTVVGNAQTGEANTNLNVFNLTGSEVFGKNAMLVFVNVLGEWVGMIVDAPAGASTALLGDGEQRSTATNSVDATTSGTISNSITATAQSGDAAVTGNSRAGNATTGNAQASASITNINNSNFSFSDWFGVLFINVLGSWHGSFGIDTAAGGSSSAPTTPTQSATSTPAVTDVRVFRISSTSSNGDAAYKVTPVSSTTSDDTSEDDQQPAVLASTADNDAAAPPTAGTTDIQGQPTGWPIPTLPILVIALGLALLAVERFISKRHHRATLATSRT